MTHVAIIRRVHLNQFQMNRPEVPPMIVTEEQSKNSGPNGYLFI